jgi:hypothetical protein
VVRQRQQQRAGQWEKPLPGPASVVGGWLHGMDSGSPGGGAQES